MQIIFISIIGQRYLLRQPHIPWNLLFVLKQKFHKPFFFIFIGVLVLNKTRALYRMRSLHICHILIHRKIEQKWRYEIKEVEIWKDPIFLFGGLVFFLKLNI